MRLSLSAAGAATGVPLFRVDVAEDGRWVYESRAVERAQGTLTPGNSGQLKNFYDEVDWELETLNAPVSPDDRTLFQLEVDRGDGSRTLYQFSDAMNHRSWQFRDLVHFLRHNVATAGDPVGWSPDGTAQPPAVH